MYKSDLKDIVAGDTVVLHSEFRGFSLETVHKVLKKQFITRGGRRYDKDGKGVTYRPEKIFAPLERLSYRDITALERYEEWEKQIARTMLVEELKAFNLYGIPTDFIEKILVMLKEEKEKHV